jgi:hypothetical protein
VLGVDELVALALLLYRHGHLLGLFNVIIVVYKYVYGFGFFNL